MDETRGAPKSATPRRRPRLIGRFPKIHIRSRAEMARALQKWRWLLEKHAQAEFGPGELADEAVRTTMVKLLAIDEPDFPHVLGVMMQTLRNQCHGIRLRLAREAADAERRKAGALFDPILDLPIAGPAAEAVERLPPAEQQAYLLAVQGVPPATIAFLLGLPNHAIRQRLYRARTRIRAELKMSADRRGSAGLLILVGADWVRPAARPYHGIVSLVRRIAVVRRDASARVGAAISKLAVSPQLTASTVLVLATASWAPVSGINAPVPTFATSIEPAVAAPLALGDAAPAASALSPGPALASPTQAPRLPVTVRVVISKDGGARTETPEDVHVTTAATPPRAPGSGPPAIVAIGTGQTCQCQVLLRSLDGGTTWTATDGPLTVLNQLVLPPAYPADPRIFGSSGESGAPPYEAASFGAPFQSVALPGGWVAVATDFDAGDPRLFVAGATGVWSLDLAPSVRPAAPHLEVGYASSSGAVAALATPPTLSGGPAILAWVPNLAVIPDSATPPHASATLMACPSSQPCAPIADLPVQPGRLAVGADAPNTVVAYTYNSAFLSHDGGRSFEPQALPLGAVLVSAAVLGSSGEVWVSLSMGPTTARVERLDATGAWLDATRRDPLLQSHAGALVPVDGRRIVDALPGAGYRCTTLGGTAWLPRCPPS